ncbi:hypothetical protein [Deinococcus pimensis]|uniref:hypothetical protein n=1 Tax=Deinococcus pimensis TaxID=309888 RepID=UPI0004891FBD|nr:hypothetical protein [Deinococcus pimensis]
MTRNPEFTAALVELERSWLFQAWVRTSPEAVITDDELDVLFTRLFPHLANLPMFEVRSQLRQVIRRIRTRTVRA